MSEQVKSNKWELRLLQAKIFELLSQGVGKLYSSIHLKKTHRQHKAFLPEEFKLIIPLVPHIYLALVCLLAIDSFILIIEKGFELRGNTLKRTDFSLLLRTKFLSCINKTTLIFFCKQTSMFERLRKIWANRSRPQKGFW